MTTDVLVSNKVDVTSPTLKLFYISITAFSKPYFPLIQEYKIGQTVEYLSHEDYSAELSVFVMH